MPMPPDASSHAPAPAPAPASAPGLAVTSPSWEMEADVLLLDMDGTLIDSGPSVERSWDRLFAELGSSRRFDHTLHGCPARQVLRDVFPDMPEEEIAAAHARIEDYEVADVEGIRVLPGTRRVLEQLDVAAAQLGRPTWTIVTSCSRRLFEGRWGVTGLPVPAGMVTADQVTLGKPDPEPYLLGAQRMRRPIDACLVVEDSLGGLRSGRAAGALTLAVTTTTPAAELGPRADAVIGDLDDIDISVVGDSLRISLPRVGDPGN